MSEPGVCTSEDDFTRERWLTDVRWVVRLSDGTEVVQDDGRPGTARSAWLRLGDHVRSRGLKVEAMRLQFRNEPPVRLPDRAEGYFFRTSVGAVLNGGPSFGFYLAGWLEGGRVRVRRWKVPEMLAAGDESRDPDDPESVGPSLIRN